MRLLFLITLATILFSCSAKQTLLYPLTILKSIDNQQFNFEQVLKLNYASLYIDYKGSKSIMILAYDDNSFLTWMDSQENGLVTFHGKFTQSFGLENNFSIIDPPNIRKTFYDLRENPDQQILTASNLKFSKPETTFMKIQFIYSLNRVDKNYDFGSFNESHYYMLREDFNVQRIGWGGSNYYWINPNGEVMKSKQELFPQEPKVYASIIKKYQGKL